MTKIETLIRQFEADIRRAVIAEALEKALSFAPSFHVITGQPTLTAKGRARLARERKGPGSGVKRTPSVLEEHVSRLLATIRTYPGCGIEWLGNMCKLTTRELNLPVAKLLTSGQVVARGNKRATKYFPANRAGAR